MRVSFYKTDLLDALKLVAKAAAVKPSTPILSGIYLRAEDSKLELQATDMAIGAIAKIPANAEHAGEVVVGAKNFKEIIAKLPNDTVTLEASGTQLIITAGAARFELLTFTADDYPKVKRVEGRTFNLKASLLKEIITKTAYAAAKDDSRPLFTAIFFELGGGFLKATTTNGHRLAHFETEMETGDKFTANIPAAALRNLSAVLTEDEQPVVVTLGERQAMFEFDNYLLTTRQIEGTFPPYGKLLEPLPGFKVKINRLELKETLERVGIIARTNQYNSVALYFEPGALTVTARAETSTAQEAIAIDGGEDLKIGFNADYLNEFLTSTSEKYLAVNFGGAFEPSVWSGEEDKNYIGVITPVRDA